MKNDNNNIIANHNYHKVEKGGQTSYFDLAPGLEVQYRAIHGEGFVKLTDREEILSLHEEINNYCEAA